MPHGSPSTPSNNRFLIFIASENFSTGHTMRDVRGCPAAVTATRAAHPADSRAPSTREVWAGCSPCMRRPWNRLS